MSMAEFLPLLVRENELKAEDVLIGRYNTWNGNEPNYNVKRKKILLEDKNGHEVSFVTPVVKAMSANVNQEGVQTSYGKSQHILNISKQLPPSWNLGDNSLPYAPGNPNYFEKLEQIVIKCMRVAFEDPELFEKATEEAWNCVNIEAYDNPDDVAFKIFLSRANLPFNKNVWTIKKNTIKGKNTKQYITTVDIANVEHTGNINIDKNALVSACIRLWPYYMSEKTYGVTASFNDAGIKIYHKGGHVTPRRTFNVIHTCIVKAPPNVYVYDIRGGTFSIKTPVGTYNQPNIFSLSSENNEKWLDDLSNLCAHFDTNGIECAYTSSDNVHTLSNINGNGMVYGQRYILSLKCNVVENVVQWEIINKFKI
tara:strand:- start:27 stop:1127 length:1101 start_codon:yes stop_codon:yes gene_type:complete